MLWDTTMDPQRRTLLQVKMEDAAAADQIFSVLMGEDVEARRDFYSAERQGHSIPRYLKGLAYSQLAIFPNGI